MKDKGSIKKYLSRAEDRLDEIEWKMKCMDGILFYVCLGMESYYEEEGCYELNTIQVIQEYLNTLRTVDIAKLRKQLEHIKKIEPGCNMEPLGQEEAE